MATRNLTHLMQRGDVFYFRRAVPRPLWVRMGRREVCLSLRTRDVSTARLLCRLFSNRFEQFIEAVEGMPGLTKDKIDNILRGYFEGLLSRAEEIVFLGPQDSSFDRQFEIDGTEEEHQELQAKLASGQFDRITRSETRELIETQGIASDQVPADEYRMLCNGVLRARIEQRRILAAMLSGALDETIPKDPLFQGVKSPGLPALPGEEPTVGKDTLDAVIARYCDFKMTQDWVPKTADEKRRILGWFCDQVGPTRKIKDVTVEDVRAFRDLLIKLPKHFTKLAALAGKTLPEIVAVETDVQKLGAGTLQKYFSSVRSFLQWCEDEGYIEMSPALKIKVGKKADIYDARHPFSHGQLKALFTSPQFTGHRSASRRSSPGDALIKDGRFWLPLLALYSGLRMGEIVQLLVADVQEEKGIWHFDVNKDEGGSEKQLKTKSSRRKVPVHPDLVRMGFLDYVSSRRDKDSQGRIFSEIKPGKNGYFSHNFSKFFSRYLDQIGVKTGKTSFHSLRHNFTDALREAEVEDSHIKALLGHSDKSVTASYGLGGGGPLQVLSKDVARISYDLDFLHLFVDGGKD